MKPLEKVVQSILNRLFWESYKKIISAFSIAVIGSVFNKKFRQELCEIHNRSEKCHADKKLRSGKSLDHLTQRFTLFSNTEEDLSTVLINTYRPLDKRIRYTVNFMFQLLKMFNPIIWNKQLNFVVTMVPKFMLSSKLQLR